MTPRLHQGLPANTSITTNVGDGAMARGRPSVSLPSQIASNITGEDSDYGTDVEDAAWDEAIVKAESQPLDEVVLTSIDQDPVTENAVGTLRIHNPPCPGDGHFGSTATSTQRPTVEIEYDNLGRSALSPYRPNVGDAPCQSESQQEVSNEPEKDERSPLERFRTKKPLSVTDMVSPAWCEQQYLYSLSKYGRVRKTPAMKQGSSVHRVLERQVHAEVRVEVTTREDMFGLRIWNVIQGLRTLRTTGLTRELEVWGVLDGQVVNGIVDQVSTSCPDETMLQRILNGDNDQKSSNTKKKNGSQAEPLGANQPTLNEFFKASSQETRMLEETSTLADSTDASKPEPPSYFLVDVKTRQSRTLPAQGAPLRPTQMQLMLYHRLLSNLAANSVPAEIIFERYRLDGKATFSDAFIAGVGNTDFHTSNEDASADTSESSQDSVSELLEHNSLASLWEHMMAEFSKTLSNPQTSLSPLLSAEFRTADSGSLLGTRSFAMDYSQLESYAQDELSWWKGERDTKGVEIEEAFKCRICEFAEGCTWRKEKIDEATQKARLRKGKTRQKSESAAAQGAS